jgi:hypothetical protein
VPPLSSPGDLCDTSRIDTDPLAGEDDAGADHVLDGHDILGVPLAAPGSGEDGQDAAILELPSFDGSAIDGIAQRLDGLLVPDEPTEDLHDWEESALVPDHLAQAFDGPWDDLPPPDGGDDANSLDPGGVELLEGPILDSNLDGVDDTVQSHGHG